MRIVLLLVIAISLAGCAGAPQTREGFKESAKSNTLLGTVDTYTANRRFEEVIAMLDRKWQECYSRRSTTTRTQGGMTTMNYQDTFNPQSRKVSDSLVEMTLQVTTTGMIMLSKVPPGGDFVIALDVERLPANRTRLTWHAGPGKGSYWEKNKQWSDGKDVACN
jgi:alpha-L-fucosidase